MTGVLGVSLELWLAFVVASAVLPVISGPTVLMVISYSLTLPLLAHRPA